MKRIAQTILLVGLFLGLTSFPSRGVESQMRALQWAYMMNFIYYVSWPNSSIDPVVKVCIVGNNPFDVSEGDVKLNEKNGTITVTLLYDVLPEVSLLKECDLIYFASDITLAQLSFVFSGLAELPILTIGEHRGFNKLGGLLQFIERNKKLGFRLNKTLLGARQLKVHPSLMRLSD